MDGTNIDPYLPPASPSPSPASANVSCQGANKFEKNIFFDDFSSLLLKGKKGPLSGIV